MLKTRVITAVISLVILMSALFVVPPVVAQGFIAIVILVGAWEWSGFLGISANAGRYLYTALMAALMVLTVSIFAAHTDQILQVACMWWFIAFIWTFLFPTPIPIAIRWICGVLVLLPLYVALLALYKLSPQLLLFSLIIVWAADIGAYFAGKQFGRVKLAPNISPGKTWEGVFGGFALVIALSVAWAMYADLKMMVVLPFCLAVAALSVVGDLTVSMFKRTAGVKDSGKLFPGHGGALDRVDSVAAAGPLFALGISWLGLV